MDLFVCPFHFPRWESVVKHFAKFIYWQIWTVTSYYISYWNFFWQISYRKDTLLNGVSASCWMSRGWNSHTWKRCGKKPRALPTVLLGRHSHYIAIAGLFKNMYLFEKFSIFLKPKIPENLFFAHDLWTLKHDCMQKIS